ncbi:MAG TPA: hypothetical protein VM925_16395 [Labilithrix sp.]|nr:hypothetical protein [Labilithrix sp.]
MLPSFSGTAVLRNACIPSSKCAPQTLTFFWGSPHFTVALGPAQLLLANLAALLQRPEARKLYEAAVAACERMGAIPFLALARRGLAALGGPSWPPSPSRGSSGISLVREGDLWLITSFTGTPVRLKDAKGLHYLERLIASPGRELHVTDLAGLEEPASDAGPVLDAQAKASYKRRLEDLTDELEEARRFDDTGRAERAQREIDVLTQQLSAAVGLCGRDRKSGSLAERARVNVQRRIRVALQQIAEQDRTLGNYLGETVKTGFFCVFKPT